MVMGADDRGEGFSYRRSKYFPWMGERQGCRAGVNSMRLISRVFSVEAENPEFLDLKSDCDRCQVGNDEIGTAVAHSPPS
jgi:hypothetical protein